MSVLIKGMDMPKDLTSITVIMHGLEWDYSQRVYRDNIVEIPTPHGRLIDEDELLSHLSKDPLFDLVERYGISGVIESRPTILEAEE